MKNKKWQKEFNDELRSYTVINNFCIFNETEKLAILAQTLKELKRNEYVMSKHLNK